jgi:serine/threonine protein kinase
MGAVRFGAWERLEKIGAGGNGTVWKVRHADGTFGAAKLLHDRHLRDKHRYQRFRDEVEVLRRCHGIAGVLPILDASLPSVPSSQKLPWIVTGFAVPLLDALGDPPPFAGAIAACTSIAATLADLHSQGITLRDIKPDNLFRQGEGWAIGDFGLAQFPGKTPITDSH